MGNFTEYSSCVRFIKKHLPLEHPVSVRRVTTPIGRDGDCDFRNEKFHIRIDRELTETYAIEVFLHEYAHCLSWEQEEDCHGIKWGKAYSLVYRTFLKWNTLL